MRLGMRLDVLGDCERRKADQSSGQGSLSYGQQRQIEFEFRALQSCVTLASRLTFGSCNF
jgi:hypothetical protein